MKKYTLVALLLLLSHKNAPANDFLNITGSALSQSLYPMTMAGKIAFGTMSICDFLTLNWTRAIFGLCGFGVMSCAQEGLVKGYKLCAERVSDENKGVGEVVSAAALFGGISVVGLGAY